MSLGFRWNEMPVRFISHSSEKFPLLYQRRIKFQTPHKKRKGGDLTQEGDTKIYDLFVQSLTVDPELISRF
jgi:hypothetical protein